MTPAQTPGLSRGREKTLADRDKIKEHGWLFPQVLKRKCSPCLSPNSWMQRSNKPAEEKREPRGTTSSEQKAGEERRRSRHVHVRPPTSREFARCSLIKETESIVKRNVQREEVAAPRGHACPKRSGEVHRGRSPAHTENPPPQENWELLFSILGSQSPGGEFRRSGPKGQL